MDDVPQHDTSAAPLPRRAPRRRWWRRHAWVTVGLAAAALLLIAFVVVQAAVADRIGPGVSVAGVDVGDLSVPEAEDRLTEELVPKVSLVTLRAGEEPLVLTLESLGIAVDVPAAARAAHAHGRHDLPFGLSVWLPFGGDDPAPVVRVDADAYDAGLEAVRAAVDEPARDAALDFTGGEVTVVPGEDGLAVDPIALERAILAAVAEGRAYAGDVPVTAVSPKVGTAEAEERAGAAAIYLSRPVTLRLRERSFELSPDDLAGMLTVNPGQRRRSVPAHVRQPEGEGASAQAVRLRRDTAAERPDRRPQGRAASRCSPVATASSWTWRSWSTTSMPPPPAAASARSSSRCARRLPQLSSADVESMGLASLGSQFTTYFDPSNPGRATNIALAAKLVDGTIVQPGEVFSLNATMGPRSVNRGFDFAPVIAGDGVLRQGVGGGICQYATTLFNAVFFAGLPVVERHAHGLLIAHYPMGRDATVSWGGPDFKFRNDTAKAVMIRSWVEGDALTVALVGKTGRSVTYTTSHYYDVRKPSSSRADPRVVYDSDLSSGVTRWELGVGRQERQGGAHGAGRGRRRALHRDVRLQVRPARLDQEGRHRDLRPRLSRSWR